MVSTIRITDDDVKADFDAIQRKLSADKNETHDQTATLKALIDLFKAFDKLPDMEKEDVASEVKSS
jgi:hypothetical protein